MLYHIVNCEDPALFWSDVDGWVLFDYDYYDEYSRQNKRLPLLGMWETETTTDVGHTDALVT